MCLDGRIDAYVGYFKKLLDYIPTISNRWLRKTAYVAVLDCMSLCAFPSETGNRRRFVRLVDELSSWEDKDRVSSSQLYLCLKRMGLTTSPLFRLVSDRVNSRSEGAVIPISDDPTMESVVPLVAGSGEETRLAEKARFAELL